MLSLVELKDGLNLAKIRDYVIEVNEQFNSVLAEKMTIKKSVESAKQELADLKQRLHYEVIPHIKLELFTKFDEAFKGKQKVAKSEIEELVYTDDRVKNLAKVIHSIESSITALESKKQELEILLESLKGTDDRLTNIARIDGLRAKIQYGMTVIKADGYLERD